MVGARGCGVGGQSRAEINHFFESEPRPVQSLSVFVGSIGGGGLLGSVVFFSGPVGLCWVGRFFIGSIGLKKKVRRFGLGCLFLGPVGFSMGRSVWVGSVGF